MHLTFGDDLNNTIRRFVDSISGYIVNINGNDYVVQGVDPDANIISVVVTEWHDSSSKEDGTDKPAGRQWVFEWDDIKTLHVH